MLKIKNKSLNLKSKKSILTILILVSITFLGVKWFLDARNANMPKNAQASSIIGPNIYQQTLSPVTLNPGQSYNLNSSNIKFGSTNRYYEIKLDYTFSTPGKRNIFATLKGLGSSSVYPISNLCVNGEFEKESYSGAGSFSGSGSFGLKNNYNSKISITMPYTWKNNPSLDNCSTSNTDLNDPTYEFSNYNIRSFELNADTSAVVSINEIPSTQIPTTEILYFITELPKKSTIILSGVAENQFLSQGWYNFRPTNPAQAGVGSSGKACQGQTYSYLNLNTIDCFTQKDLETGKVKLQVTQDASRGSDQIKLIAFDKFNQKAFTFNYNISSLSQTGQTEVGFVNKQVNNSNSLTTINNTENQPSSSPYPNSLNQSLTSNLISNNTAPAPTPLALKSISQSGADTSLTIDAKLMSRRRIINKTTNYSFTLVQAKLVDPSRKLTEFECKLKATGLYSNKPKVISDLNSVKMDAQGNCKINFTKQLKTKYAKNIQFQVVIIDTKTNQNYISNSVIIKML